MKKKIAIALTLAVMTVSLTGCSLFSSDEKTQPLPANNAPAQTEKAETAPAAPEPQQPAAPNVNQTLQQQQQTKRQQMQQQQSGSTTLKTNMELDTTRKVGQYTE